MKLNRSSIQNPSNWYGYTLPSFDVASMVERTKNDPIWLHMGAGNIFRIFPAVMQQKLLDSRLTDKGIIICECYDEEIVPTVFTPHDNLSLALTLKSDGTTDKKVVASMAEAITAATHRDRLMEICASPSLQIISFTITEKGYTVQDPLNRNSMIGYVTDGLLARYKAGAYPLALSSMDNCAQNGDVLKNAVKSVAEAWFKNNMIEEGFLKYIDSLAFPWSMIDKITPRPSTEAAEMLRSDGYEDANIITTKKGTWISSFVIAEESQYLVIEDTFPNGRPPLEKAGLIFADKETVEKIEKMKVCTCLNPLHTVLAIYGCLMEYETVSEIMQDPHLVSLLKEIAYKESMPVVTDPKVIDPKEFLQEVLEKRFPNPFMKDTPQRIAQDTSQKIPVRFGETLKLRRKAGLPDADLNGIPFFFALWLRYLQGLNDNWEPMTIQEDPRKDELTSNFNVKNILSDASIFGVDLYSNDGVLGKKTEAFFEELNKGSKAVSQTIAKHWG